MTEEKVPYLQCLYHTGKTVYKYWFAGLGIAALLIAIGLIINKLWDSIIEAFGYVVKSVEFIWNSFDNAALIIGAFLNNLWIWASAIPWYWWVAFCVTVGPIIIVAIYCALKRCGVKWADIGIMILTALVILACCCGILNLIIKGYTSNFGGVVLAALSTTFFILIICVLGVDNGCDYYD